MLRHTLDTPASAFRVNECLGRKSGGCVIQQLAGCSRASSGRLKSGRGWDVMMIEDGEPVFSRRCVDER
jgi:hypothetical protein